MEKARQQAACEEEREIGMSLSMDTPEMESFIRLALEEDLGGGDVTSEALVAPADRARATLIAKDHLVVAGAGVAGRVFQTLNQDLTVEILAQDGATVLKGETIMVVEGSARALLSAERTALNLLQRLCGIATMTRAYVEMARPFGVHILDTRKTTPGMRVLEKYAVSCGGGVNHRMGLYDMAMIKDNHRAMWKRHGTGGLAGAVHAIRAAFPGIQVEVEVEDETQLREALEATPEWILLDNMPTEQMRRCVEITDGRCHLEASGGMTLRRVAEVAATGVNAISVGALTHSAPSADISLEFEEETQ